MSQFAVLRSKDVIGYIEDDKKGILTIFLSNGDCCVILEKTLKDTLVNYNMMDVEDLFYSEVFEVDDPNYVIVFGLGALNTNVNTDLKVKELTAFPKEPTPKKKYKF